MGTDKTSKRPSDNKDEQQSSIKRLKFFTDFLAMEDLSLDDVANIVGMTRPSISHWIAIDDARLDLVQDIIESCGYEFEVFLSRNDEEIDGSKRISIDDFITLKKDEYRPKRLSFLTLALLRYNIGKVELAKSLSMAYTSIRYWFSKDTITVKNLFAVCEAWDFSIRISIHKKAVLESTGSSGNVPSKQKRLYTVQISKETVMNL